MKSKKIKGEEEIHKDSELKERIKEEEMLIPQKSSVDKRAGKL